MFLKLFEPFSRTVFGIFQEDRILCPFSVSRNESGRNMDFLLSIRGVHQVQAILMIPQRPEWLLRSASTTFNLVMYPAIRFLKRFEGVITRTLTDSLSASKSPVKRSGNLLNSSLEAFFTVSVRTLPKLNRSETELDMQGAFNINFAESGSVTDAGDGACCRLSRDELDLVRRSFWEISPISEPTVHRCHWDEKEEPYPGQFFKWGIGGA